VTLNDGTQHVCEVTFPRGHARNPMTDAEVEKKFRLMAKALLPEAKVTEAISRCFALENEPNSDALLALFAGAAR
jgi:2-methylcitrate dehydratase